MQCYTCFGKGHTTITCPTCHGKGSYWKANLSLKRNDWHPCSQCGGRRTVQLPCPTCGGRRVLPDPTPQPSSRPVNPPSQPLPPDPELLKLKGRWKGGGGRYELERDHGGYSVTFFNLFGWKLGTGQATISGRTLTLTVKTFMGTNTADLQLKGGRLQGVMRTLGGLPWPLALRRA